MPTMRLPSGPRKRAIFVLVAVLAFTLAVLAGGWLVQRRLIYFPTGEPPPVAAVLPGAEEVSFTTGDGIELAGWYLPAADEVAVAIVFNGNAGNRADRAGIADRLAARGISTLVFDYRGYGGNGGHPTESGLLRDALAARSFVAERSSAPVVYFGESLGSGVAVALAVEQPPDVLVLRSPFTSLVDVGKEHYPFLPVGWLLKDTYPSIDRIGSIDVPLLVVAGSDDEVVPIDLSERLFDAAGEPKEIHVVDGARHNDAALTSSDNLADVVAGFVRSAVS
jgi:fermentation-respiration switch protein FrsA (DUF1100 family)